MEGEEGSEYYGNQSGEVGQVVTNEDGNMLTGFGNREDMFGHSQCSVCGLLKEETVDLGSGLSGK